MEKKEFIKKYLKTVTILFFVLFAISLALVFGISLSEHSTVTLSIIEKTVIALGCSYLPCASFSGFCFCFYKFNQADKKAKIMLTVLFPLTLVLVTAVGCLSFVPCVFYSICFCVKNSAKSN